jgi:hypothetical protein
MEGHNQGEASKAYRLRKMVAAGARLKPLDMAWLTNYDREKAERERQRAAAVGRDVGASRSKKSRKLHVDLEEHAEAESVGTGNAAIEAAAAAVMVDAEGKRIDTLTINALKILERCIDGWERMGTVCRKVLREQQTANVELMRGFQQQFRGALSLESQLRRLTDERTDGDPMDDLMAMIAARHFGVDPELLPSMSKAAGRFGGKTKKPPKNGAPKE